MKKITQKPTNDKIGLLGELACRGEDEGLAGGRCRADALKNANGIRAGLSCTGLKGALSAIHKLEIRLHE